jgi:arylsulfatase
MDSHVPYYPPEDYRRLDRPVSTNSWEPFKNGISNLKEVTTAYEDCVGYISDKYRTIFNKLKNNFDYVITLSDHGEMLGEFGMIEHAYGLYPSLVNIPVVISGPGIANTQIDTPISILDVHATIADLAGVSTDSRGHSLLQDEIQPRDRLVEYHGFPPWIRTSFLENGISEQEYERLNRPLRGFIDRDGVYSFETHSDGLVVECQEPEDLEQREEKLEKLQSEVDQREIKQEQSGASEAVLSRLEDLGYA